MLQHAQRGVGVISLERCGRDIERRQQRRAVKARVDKSGKLKRPIVTEIADAGAYTRAEDYHQDYLVKNPGGYTCHYLRD